ncbi:ParB/RepB/Spo0J family partition protein [Amycolatopsis sp. NPDC004079]|uniref:ParB/RepB/Spo0J family partition protein n=1 Tax=Amycolatopsis sp. NPDC004079 TaxID=3154549 RepID=UPI0033B05B23
MGTRNNRVGGGAAAVIGSRGPSKPSKPAAGNSALLEQMRQAAENVDVATLPRIRLDKIAPHPDNPKRRSNPNTPKMLTLKHSIEEHGFLQPLTLATRADIVAASPELEDLIDPKAEFVSIIGHMRTVAGALAGEIDAPAIIRTKNLSRGEIAAIFFAENKHRDSITPIEEAEAFDRMLNNGYSQEQVAQTLGVSQPHVAKTRALLDLPEILIEAVNAEQLNRADASRLLKISKTSEAAALAIWQDHLDEVKEIGDDDAKSPTPIATLINRQRAAAELRAREDDLRAVVREHGIELLPDSRPVTDLVEVAAEDALGEERERVVGARISNGHLTYLAQPVSPPPTTSIENDAADDTARSDPADGPVAAASEDDRVHEPVAATASAQVPVVSPVAAQRRSAAEAASRQRAEACRLFLQSELPPATVDQTLMDGVLYAPSRLDAKMAKVVSSWLDRKIRADRDIEAQVESKAHRQRVSLAVVLAAIENEASREKYDTEDWPPYVQRHVARLRDLGHLNLDQFMDDKLASNDVG